jgi:two-component sensor histidine kinase
MPSVATSDFRSLSEEKRTWRGLASTSQFDPQRTFWLEATSQPDTQTILISVRDEGAGLPSDFDPAASKRLGTRLVNAPSQQLKGELTRRTASSGVSFTLAVPL